MGCYKYIIVACFVMLLYGCTKSPVPLNSSKWGFWDITIDNERNPYTIEGKSYSYCVKESEGWNIDFNPAPLAYLDLYFDKGDLMQKAVLRKRSQSFKDKMDGLGKVSSDRFDTVMVWHGH